MKKRILQLSIFLFLATTSHAYYQAEQGRWLNRDPIEERGGVNLYGILFNDVITRVDPVGLKQRGMIIFEPGVKPHIQGILNEYNPISISENFEYCGFICRGCDPQTGKKDLIYATVTKGVREPKYSCDPREKAKCNEGDEVVEIWHTHGPSTDLDGDGKNDGKYKGYPNIMGGDDKSFADNLKVPINLATPSGKWLRYDPANSEEKDPNLWNSFVPQIGKVRTKKL